MSPTIGRIVHFHVAGSGVRAAIVTHVWGPRDGGHVVNLNVQLNGPGDLEHFEDGSGRTAVMRTSVDQGTGPGQWSWPERS